ncbi:hypothetical protein NS365_01255 [Aureimonas ureilytica]|uniref:Uncharacterized protein n=1 Tax=Aureimonas ureilytica TaxID=401562 RepID=A0A175RXQ7_9HYPH|nr:hypothetical protein NS365_01255 [Aureimonas ureilytica]
MAGYPAQDEEVRQDVDDIRRVEPASDAEAEAFVRELVDDVGEKRAAFVARRAELAAVVGSVLHEVVGPKVVRMFGPQPNSGTVIQPEPSTLGLLGWHLQTLTVPDALDTLFVYHPTGIPQQDRDLQVPVATVPTRQFDEVGRELLFVVPAPRHLTLCRTVLPKGAAYPTLGQLRHRHDVFDTSALARRAQ